MKAKKKKPVPAPKLDFGTVRIATLKPLPENPMTHTDAQLKQLQASMKEYGFTAPVVVLRKTKEIIAGHARVEAARGIGLKTCPVMWLDTTREKALGYCVLDNKLAELAEWDYGKLKDIFEKDIDLTTEIKNLGFGADEIQNLLAVHGDQYREPMFDELVDDFDESPKKDGNWFYVQYYGDAERFEALKAKLEGNMNDEHAIDPGFFEELIKGLGK